MEASPAIATAATAALDCQVVAQRGVPPPALPIEHVLPALRDALSRRSSAVLQAPPGAGKTTRVPLALLGAPWLGDQRIVMLEPRRLAARAAARRMATTLEEPVGGTVGFRVRGETRVGASTRVEVVTEGVLTRMLLADPTLAGTGLVIFDEFHERSVHADLGLALALHSQSLVRPDLRILVMSATLDGASVSALLDDAPVVTSEGRAHPVAIRYDGRRDERRVEDAVAIAVRAALAHDPGSVLAFLPGAAEIRRCAASLTRGALPVDVEVLSLYGDMPAEAQDRAIAPVPAGRRKVVLATSIAETSLTIEGVRVVVDSGLSRVPRFSPRTGMMRLETVRVSRVSAEQRSGRAGRTAAGVCHRLWFAEEDAHLPARSIPEILETDLAPLALDLAVAGIVDPAELRWLDAPPAAALSQARKLLTELGAITVALHITSHGMEMASLGLHPRLSHMVLRARARGAGATGCAVAALLQERDVFRRDSHLRDPDLRARVAAVIQDDGMGNADVDRDALRRVREQSRVWRELLRIPNAERMDEHDTGVLLALAYPDRVAQRRPGEGERFLLRNGTGAELTDPGSLAASSFLVAAELDGRSPQARIYLAAPLGRASLDDLFADDIAQEDVVEWDSASEAIAAVRRQRLGAIVLHEGKLSRLDADVAAQVIADAIGRGELALPWTPAAERLRDRVAFMRTFNADWPEFSDTELKSTVNDWLRPHLSGIRRRADVEKLDLATILLGTLNWEQRRQLDELAPTHVVVPTGSSLPIDYGDPTAPVLAVRLQEMFGLTETPRVGGGRISLTLRLLSPAYRPVQVTRDLAGFWRSSYFDVRKDLRGRYPKHEWPEDPLGATPTKRAKPRR